MHRNRNFAPLDDRQRYRARGRLSLRTNETGVCARGSTFLVAIGRMDVARNNEQPHQQPEEGCQCDPLTMLML
jgi:hypothetical protein